MRIEYYICVSTQALNLFKSQCTCLWGLGFFCSKINNKLVWQNKTKEKNCVRSFYALKEISFCGYNFKAFNTYQQFVCIITKSKKECTSPDKNVVTCGILIDT